MLIFSNNCTAGEIYKYCLVQQYQHPLIGTMFGLKDTLNIIQGFDFGMFSDVSFEQKAFVKSSNYPFFKIAKEVGYPIQFFRPSVFNDVFRAYFMHGKESIYERQKTYERRLDRLKAQIANNEMPMFLIHIYDYIIKYDFDDLLKLLQAETKFKLFFTVNNKENLLYLSNYAKHPLKEFQFPIDAQQRQYVAKSKFEWMMNLV